MIIKDLITHELHVNDNRPTFPDDGCDYSQCHIDCLHVAARARMKTPYQPKLKPQKTTR